MSNKPRVKTIHHNHPADSPHRYKDTTTIIKHKNHYNQSPRRPQNTNYYHQSSCVAGLALLPFFLPFAVVAYLFSDED